MHSITLRVAVFLVYITLYTQEEIVKVKMNEINTRYIHVR